jgi:hypothetical protein
MKIFLCAFLISITLFSCQKDENLSLKGNEGLVGSWISPQYNDTLVTYNRAQNLIENQYGFTFKSDNTLTERQLSGWCGTPPISTADYEGSWTWNDSIVNITVGYWGGKVDYTWKVHKLNEQKLVISIIKTEYHQGK